MSKVIFHDDFKACSGSMYIDTAQKNASGSGKTAYIYSNSNKEPIFVQLSRNNTKMTAPFGISDGFGGVEKSSNRKSLDISCQDLSLLKSIESIEKYVVDYMTKHSVDYFGKKKSRDTVQGMFHSCIKRSEQYRPLIRTKVNIGGKFATHFWKYVSNTSVSKGTSTDIDKHIEVSTTVRITSVWFASGRFGIILDVRDLLYFPTVVEDMPLFMGDDGEVQYTANLDANEKSTITSSANNNNNGNNDTVNINDNDVLLVDNANSNNIQQQQLNYGAF